MALYCVALATLFTNAIAAANAFPSASGIRARTGSYAIVAVPQRQGLGTHSLQINGASDLLLTGGG